MTYYPRIEISRSRGNIGVTSFTVSSYVHTQTFTMGFERYGGLHDCKIQVIKHRYFGAYGSTDGGRVSYAAVLTISFYKPAQNGAKSYHWFKVGIRGSSLKNLLENINKFAPWVCENRERLEPIRSKYNPTYTDVRDFDNFIQAYWHTENNMLMVDDLTY